MSTDVFSGIGLTIDERVRAAVLLLKAHEPEEGYFGAFSGGKDSCVIKEIARVSGVKVRWHYSVTTIDPPELVRFIRKEHPDVVFLYPKHGNFFNRMVQKGFPTRRTRWCCAEYKEVSAPVGSRIILGVRAAESPRRAATWKEITFHTKAKNWAVAPILNWSDDDVWTFIKSWGGGIKYCSLYDEGFHRLGCVGCPEAREAGRTRGFIRWPRIEALWMRAFQRLWEKRVGSKSRDGREWFGSEKFDSWQELYAWWKSDRPLPVDDDEDGECQTQLDMFSS